MCNPRDTKKRRHFLNNVQRNVQAFFDNVQRNVQIYMHNVQHNVQNGLAMCKISHYGRCKSRIEFKCKYPAIYCKMLDHFAAKILQILMTICRKNGNEKRRCANVHIVIFHNVQTTFRHRANAKKGRFDNVQIAHCQIVDTFLCHGK